LKNKYRIQKKHKDLNLYAYSSFLCVAQRLGGEPL
jgi:hypothetical protein